MSAVRNREVDCVLGWKFDRSARSTRHLLAALEEFGHLGGRFEWGGIGSPDRVRDDHHPDDLAAIVAAARPERSKCRRGHV